MLAIGRYAQCQLHFLRYVDTQSNKKKLKQCIFDGPYVMTEVIIPAKPSTITQEAVLEHTIPETYENTTLEKRAYIDAEDETIHMMLSEIGDDIYSIVDAYTTAKEMWIAIERLQLGESLNKQDVKTNLFWEFVNDIRDEKIATNANVLVLVAATQQYLDDHYQASKPHKTYAPLSKPTPSTRSHATTKNKGKEIVKPITPPSKSTSKKDSDEEQAQRDNQIQKNWVVCESVESNSCFRETVGNQAKDYLYHKEKMMLCKHKEKGMPLSAEQDEWIHDTGEEPDG
ncbi:hypothetical protein Tco_0960212 [Tanacetum coccineum]